MEEKGHKEVEEAGHKEEKGEIVESKLTISLLEDVKKLLDVAISRGSFKPNELSTVGKVYDMYSSCLNDLSKQNKEANSDE